MVNNLPSEQTEFAYSLYVPRGSGWFKIGWINNNYLEKPKIKRSPYWILRVPSSLPGVNEEEIQDWSDSHLDRVTPEIMQQWLTQATHMEVCTGNLIPLYRDNPKKNTIIGQSCDLCHGIFLRDGPLVLPHKNEVAPEEIGIPIICHHQGILYGGAVPTNNIAFNQLRQLGIKGIVSTHPIPHYCQSDLSDFDHLVLDIPDRYPPSMDQVTQFIEFVTEHMKHNEPVYVHCREGCGRTGTLIAIAEIMIFKAGSVEEAIAAVREREPCSADSPNQEKFIRELKQT